MSHPGRVPIDIEEIDIETDFSIEEASRLFDLGRNYLEGIGGAVQSEEIGIRFLRSAVERGHPGALNYLGKCYFDGTGAARNQELAAEIFEVVKHSNDTYVRGDARNSLGLCYLYGKGVQQNVALAVSCFEHAAVRDNQDAIINLQSFPPDTRFPEILHSLENDFLGLVGVSDEICLGQLQGILRGGVVTPSAQVRNPQVRSVTPDPEHTLPGHR